MRRKLYQSLIAMALSLTMLVAGVGCGGGGQPDTDQTLQIYAFEQGYGAQWVYDLAEEFKKQDWVKKAYPELQVVVSDNELANFAKNQLDLGSKKNTYDLLFGTALSDYAGGQQIANLTETVYNKLLPGEEITYSDKLKDSVKANFVYHDRTVADPIDEYYMVPYQGGRTGILYNEDLLAEYKIEIPRTTDELYAACVKIKGMGKAPFIQADDEAYWNKHIMQVWWAQYEGVQGYNNFYDGIVVDDDGLSSYNVGIFEQKGRLESLKVMEKLLKRTSNKESTTENFLHSSSFGSNNYMVQQTSFLGGTGVFHVNGDWFDDEMKERKADLLAHGGKDYTIKMMRTPIISSIIDNCPDNTIADDAELSALVKAIDEGKKDLVGEGYDVSQQTYDKILEARFIVDGTNAGVAGVIPSYAKGKAIAIDFVRFMATDIGLGVFAKATSGATLDFEFNLMDADEEVYNSISPLNKDRIQYFNSDMHQIEILRHSGSFALVKYGNLSAFADLDYFGSFTEIGNKKTAKDYYDETIAYWTEDMFRNALSNAGKI